MEGGARSPSLRIRQGRIDLKLLEMDPMPYLKGPEAVQRVREYYDSATRAFAGRRFEFLGGGGDRSGVANVFTSEDLVAVSMLSINIPGEAAIAILDDPGNELADRLARVPVGIPLWEAEDSIIDDDHSVATEIWHILRDIDGIGWVTANKLLARKRPHLFPVYDRVVKAALRPNQKDLWIPLRNQLLADDRRLLNRLEEIRSRAGLDVEPPLLRILDVAIWMTSPR